MFRRRPSVLVLAIVSLLFLSACGGGGSGSGGGGNGPIITSLTPSSITVNVPLGTLTVSGSNFTSDALILIDSQPVSTFPLSATSLQAGVSPNFGYTVATHQISVQEKSGTSNTISFPVYAPAQGQIEMNAIPGFLVGTESDPPWIAAADIDGDGLADVLVPNDVPGGSGGIAILKGQSNGTLTSATVLSMTTPDGLLVGDVDGDGLPDLVAITQGTSVSIITTSMAMGTETSSKRRPRRSPS